ncbi:hypothetical protein D9M69_627500 [compost metagenome]
MEQRVRDTPHRKCQFEIAVEDLWTAHSGFAQPLHMRGSIVGHVPEYPIQGREELLNNLFYPIAVVLRCEIDDASDFTSNALFFGLVLAQY